MLDHTLGNLFDVFAPMMSLALRFFQQYVSNWDVWKGQAVAQGKDL